MKTFALSLKLKSGLLSELQSDTIYGHFCWRLKEKFGVEKLSEFISLYKKNRPVFLLSDGLLKINDEIHFPRPFVFERPIIKNDKCDKVLEFAQRKFSKERDYLTITEVNEFLSSGKVVIQYSERPKGESKKRKRNKPILMENLRVSVQIDRHSLSSAEGRLFSYNSLHTREDVSFLVLVKVLDDEDFKTYKCESLLKEVFEVGFGKKKSSGFGQFEVDWTEYSGINEPKNPNAFVVLGNYLPSKGDLITPIGYDINTKYGKLGEELSLSENPFKNPIVFLTAGSCFRTDNKKEFYGRITEYGEISGANNFAVQFGIPFCLNLVLAD